MNRLLIMLSQLRGPLGMWPIYASGPALAWMPRATDEVAVVRIDEHVFDGARRVFHHFGPSRHGARSSRSGCNTVAVTPAA
jgi:hypothetical protein